MSYQIEIPTDEDLAYLDALDRQEEREWEDLVESREEQMFNMLANDSDCLSRHEFNGSIYLILRDSRFTGGLIWPVVVWEFAAASLLLRSHAEHRSHAHAIEHLEKIQQQLAA